MSITKVTLLVSELRVLHVARGVRRPERDGVGPVTRDRERVRVGLLIPAVDRVAGLGDAGAAVVVGRRERDRDGSRCTSR